MGLYRYISKQLSYPKGVFGYINALLMNSYNRPLYDCLTHEIKAKASDCVLEIGFGNGFLAHRVVRQRACRLYGIDLSKDMLRIASARNKKLIRAGQISLGLGDIRSTTFENEQFDTIYTVNTIYFWQDLDSCFAEIARILKPSGQFINLFHSHQHLKKGFSSNLNLNYDIDQIKSTMAKHNLHITKLIEDKQHEFVVIVGEKQ